MDRTIFTLHPLTDAARDVIRDPRNAKLLVQVDANSNDDAAPGGEALALTLGRPPKRGKTYVMGRHADADIVLTDRASSAQHCTFSIDGKGIPFLHEQSTNGTLINGKHRNNQTFEVQNGTQIEIRGAAFNIRIPWRGRLQTDYEYEVKRAKELRAETPLEPLFSRPAPIETTLEEKFGSYTFTNTRIDSLRLGNEEVSRTEVVRRGSSLFAAKRFNKGCGGRELRAWKKISGLDHVNFMVL